MRGHTLASAQQLLSDSAKQTLLQTSLMYHLQSAADANLAVALQPFPSATDDVFSSLQPCASFPFHEFASHTYFDSWE